MEKEARLYKKLKNEVICTACYRYCRLKEGQIGFCGVRKNIGGKLKLLVYGLADAVHVDPIEKKPLFHYYPGSKIFSIGTTGCDFACSFCQNWDLSHRRVIEGVRLMPEEAVNRAMKYECEGIAYTYNEPTIFLEYAHDTGVIARKNGLKNIFVSNGYMTPEAVDYIKDFLDAITVDFKGNANVKFYRKQILVHNPEKIFDTLLLLKEAKIHIEITDLIVPKIGDNLEDARKLVKWIHDNLGPETPIHFLRFFPYYKLSYLEPTPIKTLEKHAKVAREEGMEYVYIGNVPGHELENTYCPTCGKPVIKRIGTQIVEWHLDEHNRCEYCGAKVAIEGSLSKHWQEDRFFGV